MKSHEYIEKRLGVLAALVVVVISFGGLAEIVPLFHMSKTTTPIEGMKPWSAIQLEGRDIYIREGCHVCHTQMVRPFRAETERWGSKRTGPDLARLGGKYSDDWHRAHMYNPRDVVPESNMPSFPWLFQNTLSGDDTADKMRVMQTLGVPYTDDEIATARETVRGKTEIEALVAYLQGLGTVMKDR